jgi:hypothetical protein
MQRYELSVGEPWDFEGPDGQNRVIVDSLGTVTGPDLENWQSNYLLLRVATPFQFKGERVEQLIAAPRYEGDSLQAIQSNGGTVGVARVRPGSSLTPGEPFSQDDVHYVIIGSLSPES